MLHALLPEQGSDVAIGARTTGGAGMWLLTPHLTSPLEGGRD